jgi:hypothetical protein
MCKSTFLRECFADLDVPGGSGWTFSMNKVVPLMSLQVHGTVSACKVDFPRR